MTRSVLVLAGIASVMAFAEAGPCDLYAAGKTPCVAAHSTTRALYSAYNGKLYQVSRDSDGAKLEIMSLTAGGVANAGAQDSFCKGSNCVITIIYDQSGHGNHLTQAPPGGAAQGPEPGGYDKLANATAAPVMLNGHNVYGTFIEPSYGYRNNKAKGTATGNDPEGMYAVLDGTHYNGKCCFDYGNAEVNTKDNGKAHMETINFGSGGKGHGNGAGKGPWIRADLENGLFAGIGNTPNEKSPSISFRFVTAVLKGMKGQWALRGGNSKTGSLETYYKGARPAGYEPMTKEGAIVLGVGGDNSDRGQGTFYEGAMTRGYPSDKTEDQVQGNIVAAKYSV